MVQTSNFNRNRKNIIFQVEKRKPIIQQEIPKKQAEIEAHEGNNKDTIKENYDNIISLESLTSPKDNSKFYLILLFRYQYEY